MTEDKYFNDKADMIMKLLRDIHNGIMMLSDDEIRHIIYIALKEVARDTRHACVEVANIWSKLEGDINPHSSLFSVLQNAQIKGGTK